MAIFSAFAGWLTPAKAQSRPWRDVGEFREIVMAAVRSQPGVDVVSPSQDDSAKFTIASGAMSGVVDVTNLFGHLSAYPSENSQMAIDRFVRSLAAFGSKTRMDSNLVAVIRTRDYVNDLNGRGLDVVHEALAADLVVVYMFDLPDAMSPATREELAGRDLPAIRTTALDNVKKWLPKVVSDGQLGAGVLYYVEDNTMLSTALILLEDFWKSVATRHPGNVLIALPRRDQLFVFDERDPSARTLARNLITLTFEDNFNLLSPNLYARRDGKITLAE